MSAISIKNKIDRLKIEKRTFINGRFVEALDGGVIKKTSPADGRDISGISACKKIDVDLAVTAAKKSFDSKIWVNKTPQEKKEILRKLADLMEKNREEFALLDALETGRSFKNYFYDSIPKAIQSLRWFAEAVDKYCDHVLPAKPDSLAFITKEPIGVVGIILPWNDPMVVAMWKISPALLMGNSVVVKPAEQSSFSILKFAALAKEAGIPDGVLNIVTGLGEVVGKSLALHPDVSAIFFTGSSQVGKNILQYSGQSNMKRVGLECGGKSPFIVSRNCKNLARAAEVLAKNIFYNQGQICSAPSRLIIEKGVKKKFVEFLKIEAAKYVPQNPFDINSEVGCMVSAKQKQRVEKYIELGLKSGAKIIAYKAPKKFNGNCVVPVIFDEVDPQSVIAREEIFGPVLVILEVASIKEAIDLANDSKYGLAAAIWTDDFNEAHNVAKNLQSGIVHINSYGDDDEAAPFGGFKESGIGKDKSLHAFAEYSNSKTIWMKLSDD